MRKLSTPNHLTYDEMALETRKTLFITQNESKESFTSFCQIIKPRMFLCLSCKLTPSPNSHLSQITPRLTADRGLLCCSLISRPSLAWIIPEKKLQRKCSGRESRDLIIRRSVTHPWPFKLRVSLNGFEWVSIKCIGYIGTIQQPFKS